VATQTVIDQRAPFGVHKAVVGADLILRPEGELDVAYVHLLDAVMPHESDIIARVTIDLDGLDFVDTAGVRALLRVLFAHERRGRDVRIINARPLARRIFALLGSELTD
jgi:anti-anti-sigma factor